MTSAAPLSTVIALPLTGWLIRGHGWPTPFYLFGGIGILWALLWTMLIQGGTGVAPDALPTNRSTIPWKRILTSAPVWAIVITNSCFNWSFYLLLAWLPSYLKHTFGVSLLNAGLLSAAPWLASFLVANAAGALADRMLKAGRSATFVRKLMQTLGLTIGGILLSLLPSAASITIAVVLTTCAAGSFALCFAGYAPNGFDLSPRYADVIWGLSNTVGTLPGIFGVYLTGWMVDHTGTFAAPFYVTTAVSFLGAVVFLAFASGRRQFD